MAEDRADGNGADVPWVGLKRKEGGRVEKGEKRVGMFSACFAIDQFREHSDAGDTTLGAGSDCSMLAEAPRVRLVQARRSVPRDAIRSPRNGDISELRGWWEGGAREAGRLAAAETDQVAAGAGW